MQKEELKKIICDAVKAKQEQLEAYTKSVLSEPELGFKEVKTAQKKTAKFFKELDLEVEEEIALTGVKGILKGQGGGPTIAIIGELDAIGCPESPYADPQTGAAHCCGHFLQLGAMMGAAVGLTQLFKTQKLCGNIVFFAVPAEEYVEIAYRLKLREEGKIHFLGGKQELIYIDAFAGIDIALMVHSHAYSPGASVYIGESSNGFVGKTIQYIGKEAHAAAAPEDGINALNAAMLGIMGINALRETFRDSDSIRVHPIITKGGDLVNSVPADVRLETYVRAKTMEAIENTHLKVDRALSAGGDAVGAKTVIRTTPGYLPLHCPKALNELFIENARFVNPAVEIHHVEHFSGSTEMGDLSHIMPVIHPYIGGVEGALHGRDFCVADFSDACILPAQALALTAVDLLFDNAELGGQVIKNNKPLLTREEYIEKMDKYFS